MTRKQYIVDKKLQLKTAFSVVAVVIIITAAVLGVLAFSVVKNNAKIQSLNEIQQMNVEWLQAQLSQQMQLNKLTDPAYLNATRQIAMNQQKSFTTINEIFTMNKYLLMALVLVIVFEGFVLYLLIIRITHRIVGPIYVMSNYIKDIIAGKLPDVRKLRTKDELKEFYGLFSEMVDTLKKKEKGS